MPLRFYHPEVRLFQLVEFHELTLQLLTANLVLLNKSVLERHVGFHGRRVLLCDFPCPLRNFPTEMTVRIGENPRVLFSFRFDCTEIVANAINFMLDERSI